MASLTGSTLMLAGFVTSSLVLGVLRQGIVAHCFGSAAAYNAFVIAEAVPLLLLHMLFGGAMAGAVIPAVVARLREEGEHEAWRYAAVVGGIILGVCLLLTAAVVSAAPLLVSGLGVGLTPEVQAEAVSLTRILAFALPLFVAASLVTAVLNAHDEFFAPGLRNLASNVPMILVLLLVGASLGADGLVIGFMVGAGLQLAVQVPRLWRLARPILAWRDVRLRSGDLVELRQRYAPILVSHLLLQAFTLVDRSFSTLADPAGAALFLYAERIVNASRSVIAGSLAVVIFPRLARLTGAGEDASGLVSRALGVVTLTTVPFMLTLILFGDSLVTLFFEHGSFTPADKEQVAATLVGLAPAAVSFGVLILLDRIFITQQRVWVLVLFLATGLAVDVGIKIWSVGTLALVGVALGTTVGASVVALLALIYLRWRSDLHFVRATLVDAGGSVLAFGLSFGVVAGLGPLPLPPPWAGVTGTLLALALGAGFLNLLKPPAYVMVQKRLGELLTFRSSRPE